MRKGFVKGIDGIQAFATDNAWEVLDVQPAAILQRSGGCGPGKWGDLAVPDTFWGLRVTPVCKLHDIEYEVGETELDKIMADLFFLVNLLAYIKAHTRFKPVRILRNYRAMSYYSAVSEFGTEAFLKGG